MSCTCGNGNDLELGTQEGGLTLRIRPGERSSPSLVLMQADPGHLEDPAYDSPIAWPAAPVLVLPADEVAATLSPSEAPLDVVSDAQATWTITPEQTAELAEFMPARITVDGQTWWSGTVVCPS